MFQLNRLNIILAQNSLVDNFNIPDRIALKNLFRFVESDNFDFSLLNYGKEMEFLELLNNKKCRVL